MNPEFSEKLLRLQLPQQQKCFVIELVRQLELIPDAIFHRNEVKQEYARNKAKVGNDSRERIYEATDAIKNAADKAQSVEQRYIYKENQDLDWLSKIS